MTNVSLCYRPVASAPSPGLPPPIIHKGPAGQIIGSSFPPMLGKPGTVLIKNKKDEAARGSGGKDDESSPGTSKSKEGAGAKGDTPKTTSPTGKRGELPDPHEGNGAAPIANGTPRTAKVLTKKPKSGSHDAQTIPAAAEKDVVVSVTTETGAKGKKIFAKHPGRIVLFLVLPEYVALQVYFGGKTCIRRIHEMLLKFWMIVVLLCSLF